MTAVGSPSELREYSDVEYVFEPHSKVRPPVGEYVRQLWARREFISALAKSDLRGPNKNTFFGELWNVLDPLIQAAIYLMLFILIRGGRPGASPASTATMIISGVFLFNFTRAAIQGGGQSILKSKSLILNSTFPLGILPVAALYVGLLEFLPSLGIYALIHIALGQPISSGLFVFPLLFVLQSVMGLGIAFLCATATVFVRDMVNMINYILRLLLYVTPIIYPVSSLTPTLKTILAVNPLFPLFSAYQTIVLGGVPTVGQVFATACWALFFLVIGYRVFTTRERTFALRL